MRVAVIGPAHPYKGGIAQHTTTLAHRLRAAGHDPVIESWAAQYPRLLYPGQLTVDEPEGDPFHPTRRTLSWNRPDGWLRHGHRIARDNDLLILQLVSAVQVPGYLGVLAGARRYRRRVVVIAHNISGHERKPGEQVALRSLFARVDRVLVHHESLADTAWQLGARDVAMSELATHGVAGGGAAPTGDDGRVHESLLFFGMIRPYKGIDVLLEALTRARVGPRLVVAGEAWGDQEEHLTDLVTRLGLTNRVQLRIGYVPGADIGPLFAATDALVLPYLSATGSQNALLAFAHGRPVIATRVGSLADPITPGVDGLVCAPGDPAALAAVLDAFYAPGEALRLRAGVRAPDEDGPWSRYLKALL